MIDTMRVNLTNNNSVPLCPPCLRENLFLNFAYNFKLPPGWFATAVARWLFLSLFFVHFSLLFGLDLSFRPGGYVFIPSGQGNTTTDDDERYNVGGGGEVGF